MAGHGTTPPPPPPIQDDQHDEDHDDKDLSDNNDDRHMEQENEYENDNDHNPPHEDNPGSAHDQFHDARATHMASTATARNNGSLHDSSSQQLPANYFFGRATFTRGRVGTSLLSAGTAPGVCVPTAAPIAMPTLIPAPFPRPFYYSNMTPPNYDDGDSNRANDDGVPPQRLSRDSLAAILDEAIRVLDDEEDENEQGEENISDSPGRHRRH